MKQRNGFLLPGTRSTPLCLSRGEETYGLPGNSGGAILLPGSPRAVLRARTRQLPLGSETSRYDVVVVSSSKCNVVVSIYKMTRNVGIITGKNKSFITVVEPESPPPQSA